MTPARTLLAEIVACQNCRPRRPAGIAILRDATARLDRPGADTLSDEKACFALLERVWKETRARFGINDFPPEIVPPLSEPYRDLFLRLDGFLANANAATDPVQATSHSLRVTDGGPDDRNADEDKEY